MHEAFTINQVIEKLPLKIESLLPFGKGGCSFYQYYCSGGCFFFFFLRMTHRFFQVKGYLLERRQVYYSYTKLRMFLVWPLLQQVDRLYVNKVSFRIAIRSSQIRVTHSSIYLFVCL